MTNKDRLKQAFRRGDMEDVAEILCMMMASCKSCPLVHECGKGNNAIFNWLLKEEDEDDDG